MEQALSILLIGAGEFGENYIRILKELDKKNRIKFLGAVVKTDDSRKRLSEKYNINVWTQLNKNILENADASIIAAPPETHYELVKECLKYTNVFVEKPLAENYKDAKALADYAKKHNRILMVGHIFRFNSAVKKIKELIDELRLDIFLVKGQFINPIENDKGRDISLEMLHLYDIMDYIFDRVPSLAGGHLKERVEIISIKYPNNMHAVFEIGWEGSKKKRFLNFFSDRKRIMCDLSSNNIEIFETEGENKYENKIETIDCTSSSEPLEEEISAFIKALKNKSNEIVNGEIVNGEAAARIVGIAKSVQIIPKNKKPRIAIIGAGLFGANCAIFLGKFCDVVLFERNNDILMEASFINQYRHHWGYHYPRSPETVKDIKEATESFELLYNDAIIRNFPTYYCVAKEGSRVSAEDYIKFCDSHNLPYKLEYPEPSYVNRNMISASLKTEEPIYDYSVLQKIIKSHLSKIKNVEIRLCSEVIDGSIENDFTKRLAIKKDDKIYYENFDYVINVTYANINIFSYWFNFPIKLLRMDFVEAIILKLPIPKVSFAIMDGPFTNLVPTSEDNTFTLVHIKYSMLQRGVPKDGLIPESWKLTNSNKKQILEESEKWLPILKKAEIIESRYVFRGVNAYREHDDARPSEIIHHGFGCWSILGGKIINCVSAAQWMIKEIMNRELL